MTLGPNWYQTGSKTCYIPQITKFYVETQYRISANKRLLSDKRRTRCTSINATLVRIVTIFY